MTTLREAAQQALEALEIAHQVVVTGKSNNSQEWEIDEAITALRTALEAERVNRICEEVVDMVKLEAEPQDE
jgi:RPA family protein